MFANQGQGVGALAVGPEVDGLEVAAFAVGNAVDQFQAALDAFAGLVGAGAGHVEEGQAAVGDGKALVQVDGFLELLLGAVGLGQEQVDALLPAIGGIGGVGGEGHSVAVFDVARHSQTSLRFIETNRWQFRLFPGSEPRGEGGVFT